LPADVPLIVNDIDDELTHAGAAAADRRWIDRAARDSDDEDGAYGSKRPGRAAAVASQTRRLKLPLHREPVDMDDDDEEAEEGLGDGEDEEESPEDSLSKALMGDSVCICQRCFRLQQYGQGTLTYLPPPPSCSLPPLFFIPI
jgi:hypothetical protein